MRKLRSTALVAGVATLAAAGLTMAPTSAGAQEIDVSGDASGLTVAVEVPVVGPVNVGPLPSVQTPPGGSEQVLSQNVPGVVSADVLSATSGPSGGGVTSTAQVVGADVLEGEVTADVISATCSSNAGGSTGSSSLANAESPLGPIAVSPPPNTQVPLPLLGTLFLNEQVASDSPGSTSMTVNAVRLALAGPLAVVGEVLISHAACAASGPGVAGGGGGAGGGPGGPGGAGGGGTAGPASAVTGNPTFAG
jgi:hypothetical protein